MSNNEEQEIAKWMLDQYLVGNRLRQATAARGILQRFGETHIYRNKQRNIAINKGILDAFRDLTPDDVVWSRSTQTWRQRRPTDPADSRMVR